MCAALDGYKRALCFACSALVQSSHKIKQLLCCMYLCPCCVVLAHEHGCHMGS